VRLAFTPDIQAKATPTNLINNFNVLQMLKIQSYTGL
jgi:hypothetical protein